MSRDTLKGYTLGTHRTIPPTETLARFRRCAARMGITRLAEVTGLDYLGIPVVMACRPNARSLSVSQGKGLDLAAARASAFMEAAETYHAEHIDLPVRRATRAELARAENVATLARLPRVRRCRATERTELPWIEARNLLDGRITWIPYDLVHADYREPRPASQRCFPLCSNGLASGNHRIEALCAALCEVIERDAHTLWLLRSPGDRAARRLDVASVDDPACAELVARLQAAGITLSAWDMTSDIGVAAFICRIREAPGNPRPPLRPFWGAGCHLSRGVALVRAITEAVQTRLTVIAGSRDDLERREFEEKPEARLYDLANLLWEKRAPARRFAEMPDRCHADFAQDLADILQCLRAAGIDEAYAVDLDKADIGMPVVRVLVPGLEYVDDVPGYLPGPRARRLKREAAR